jgi:hypothetical protein
LAGIGSDNWNEDRRDPAGRSTPLLTVFDQNLVAAPADPGAMLLQAGQHRLIAIIHDGSAVPHHVAGAGIVLPLRWLRGSRRSNGKRGKGDNGKKRNKPDHYFSPQKTHPRSGPDSLTLQASTHSHRGRISGRGENSEPRWDDVNVYFSLMTAT